MNEDDCERTVRKSMAQQHDESFDSRWGVESSRKYTKYDVK